MIQEYDIRRKLALVLEGKMEVEDFEDWLVPTSWNMHLDSSQRAQDLVWAIELLLSEYSSSHRTEQSLRLAFQKLLSEVKASFDLASGAPVKLVELVAQSASPSFQIRSFLTAAA
jgi:hypothetical protein